MKYDILQEPTFSEHLSGRILNIYKESWEEVYPERDYEEIDKSLLEYACSRVQDEMVKRDYLLGEPKRSRSPLLLAIKRMNKSYRSTPSDSRCRVTYMEPGVFGHIRRVRVVSQLRELDRRLKKARPMTVFTCFNRQSRFSDGEELSHADVQRLAEFTAQETLGISATAAFELLDSGALSGKAIEPSLRALKHLLTAG